MYSLNLLNEEFRDGFSIYNEKIQTVYRKSIRNDPV